MLKRTLWRAGAFVAPLLLSLGLVAAPPASAAEPGIDIPLTVATPDYACGEDWWEPLGRYYLKWQCDGNLVLYSSQDGSARWASGTYGWPNITNPTTKLNFSRYGYMSIRDHNGSIVCAWGGPESAGGYVRLQSDGNLVVYASNGNAVWASGTYGWRQGSVHACGTGM
ncbi:hypothetical protein [Streptomyces tanashiensis]|uniref:hypothetical protein n=1 Tax=Streptomyces tanashiensis TaxID=67367 RepID=UPI00341CC58D